MDIRQLRYFVAIVEEGTISAAAKKLHMAQPPLSQQLKTMENELGTLLLERQGRYLKVTEAGKKLYGYAQQIIELMEEASIEIMELSEGISGNLSIGVNTFSMEKLSNPLHIFKQLFPKITYKIHQNESAVLCELMRNRIIELAFIRQPLDLDEFYVVHLYTEPFYLVISNKLLPKESDVTLEKTLDFPLMLPSTKGMGVHYLIQEAFIHHHLQPRIIGECSDISLLMNLVSTKFCATVIPETWIENSRYSENLLKVPLPPTFGSPVSMIWLRNYPLSKAAQNFIQLIQQDK